MRIQIRESVINHKPSDRLLGVISGIMSAKSEIEVMNLLDQVELAEDEDVSFLPYETCWSTIYSTRY
jgi:hypothetical protein